MDRMRIPRLIAVIAVSGVTERLLAQLDGFGQH
jgi:hypothetical protein